MHNYEEDSDDDIENNNEKVNHLENNNKNYMQYIIATYFCNKYFMYILTAQDTLPLNKASTSQHFVLDQYTEMVF